MRAQICAPKFLRTAGTALGLWALFALTGCPDAPDMRVEDYNQACVVAADCVVVNAGYICTCDQLGALNKDSLNDYSKDANEASQSCPVYEGISSTQAQLDPCYPAQAVCDAGVCAVQRNEGMRDTLSSGQMD